MKPRLRFTSDGSTSWPLPSSSQRIRFSKRWKRTLSLPWAVAAAGSRVSWAAATHAVTAKGSASWVSSASGWLPQAERSRVRASFVVERLDYLAMGGRCSAVAALLGGKLKLKPRIEVTDGKMQAGKKYRGNQDKVILKYVQDMEEQLRRVEEKLAEAADLARQAGIGADELAQMFSLIVKGE